MFCNQTVLLARLEKRVFKNNETFHAGIEMAHVGMDPLPDLELVCRVTDGSGKTLHQAILQDGGKVLLLGFGKVREDKGDRVAIGFSSIFWNTAWTGGQAPHTLGILVDPDHPLFGEFPTEYHSNWQWWDPVSHSQAMILDHFPGSLKPLIQPIDTWFENRRLGLAFEVNAGQGKLFVCSIDLQQGLSERPVSRQLLHSILKYLNSSDFDPKVRMKPDQVRELFMD